MSIQKQRDLFYLMLDIAVLNSYNFERQFVGNLVDAKKLIEDPTNLCKEHMMKKSDTRSNPTWIKRCAKS